MKKRTNNYKVLSLFTIFLLALLFVLTSNLIAGEKEVCKNQGKYWDVIPEEENPSPFYDSILYSEIAPKLREIELNSNRVNVDVIGQSAGGRDLFLVTLSAPEAMGRLGQYKAISKTMLKDPEKALNMIENLGDFKVPVFINGSIHGSEYPGTDAAIQLIETLAYGNTPEIQNILNNVILIVNVVQNPDGRVMGTRRNANGFDINRDFMSQTQPETKITVNIMTEWNPMITLDLHGFVYPMLIEPCTPPHNPNYEYDLYLQWALNQAYAMEDEVFVQTGFDTSIPYRDWSEGWDDWGAQYVPMYSMYHGSYGHTIETPYRDARGVDAHYAAVWGALNFVAQNRKAMFRDQLEIYRRGFLDLPQMLIPDELLDETTWDQFNEMTIQEFPAAYIIPTDKPFQQSSYQAARLINFLLFNDVQVNQASKPFSYGGTEYPKGTYVVWMDQPKRGLANTILNAGPDLSDVVGISFYSPPSVWSQPLLWGTHQVVMEDHMNIETTAISKAEKPKGSVYGDYALAYAFEPNSIISFQVANELVDNGVIVQRASSSFAVNGTSFAPGTFIVPADATLADELANKYGLDVFAINEMPVGTIVIESQKIAVYADEGTHHALKVLGFDYDEVERSDVNDGVVENYDLFLNQDGSWGSFSDAGRASLLSFFAAGGDYVGLRNRGIQLAIDAGIIDVDYESNAGNAIVDVEFNQTDVVAGGFQAHDFAFVYTPVWFTRLGDDVMSSAQFSNVDFLTSGYWPNWQISGAEGKPVAVHYAEDNSDTTLIGLDVTFRGHPENTFRLLGNAILQGLD